MSLFFVLQGDNMDKNKKQSAAEIIYSVMSTLIICMMCIFTAFAFLFRIVTVDGSSMNPGLCHKDKIIISGFLYKPDYGDIIAVGRENCEEKSIIKRVIALPGDELMINFDNHLITVNNKVIFEDYKVTEGISVQGDFTYPLTVPEDCVFVLGDNRNNSVDSRFESVGFIKIDEIAGKALCRIFPPGNFNIY